MTKIGRPSSFTEKVAAAICTRISAGESLRAICADADMPHMSTVMRWLGDEAHQSFREQYGRAREAQADTLFDEILQIADTPMLGEVVTTKPILVDGKPIKGAEVREVRQEDMLAHRRLQIDARKWIAGKLAPKKYGDKLELEHKGDPSAPIAITLVRQPDGGSDGN